MNVMANVMRMPLAAMFKVRRGERGPASPNSRVQMFHGTNYEPKANVRTESNWSCELRPRPRVSPRSLRL